MTCYQHPSGKWVYDFEYKRTRYQKYGYTTMRAASNAEHKRREQLRLPDKLPGDYSFQDLCNLYLEYCEGFQSKRGYLNKKYTIKKYFKKWSKLMADELTPAMIEQHMIERKAKSPGAANADRKWLHAMYHWGKARGYVPANPCASVKRIPSPRKKKVYIPPPADIAKVMLVASPVRRDMISLQQHLVARGNEINTLTWDDIDLVKREATLWTSKSAGGNAVSRMVYLNDSALKILTRLAQERRKDIPWVFPHPATLVPRTQRHWLRNLCIKAGVKPFGTHALRHYSASRLLEARTSPKLIQAILGHTSFATTDRYLHLLAESDEMKTAMQILENK